MIELKNVSKIYELDSENFTALNNINLKILKKEFISIVGPSGCGKSTLMHIIGLLDEPTTGEILVDGQLISKLSDIELSSLRNEFFGFVFQQFNLINKFNVLENIMLPVIYSRKKLAFNPEHRAKDLMSRFEIGDKARSFPNKLSGGQQQRVAIARALMNNPQVILADEPTGNLDSKTGHAILSLLKKLNKEDNLTVVIVSHDKEIARISKRIITMLDGQIIKSG